MFRILNPRPFRVVPLELPEEISNQAGARNFTGNTCVEYRIGIHATLLANLFRDNIAANRIDPLFYTNENQFPKPFSAFPLNKHESLSKN
jgi:hypothetical protein